MDLALCTHPSACPSRNWVKSALEDQILQASSQRYCHETQTLKKNFVVNLDGIKNLPFMWFVIIFLIKMAIAGEYTTVLKTLP